MQSIADCLRSKDKGKQSAIIPNTIIIFVYFLLVFFFIHMLLSSCNQSEMQFLVPFPLSICRLHFSMLLYGLCPPNGFIVVHCSVT